MSSNAKTAAAKNEAKPALVPKLRFLDFRATGWIQKKLEEVAPLQRGFDLPSDLIRPGNIPIVYSNGIQKYHEVGMATAPGLVTGRSGTIGKLHFIESGDYWPHNTSLWVTSFNGNVPRFVFYLYDSIGMSRFSSGSGVPTLNRNDVHAFGVSIPSSSAEQQKVADCLSSLDELIAAQARKVDALKTHKKGLMQQLFPREAETQPRLRFPEFQNAEEWVIDSIGNIFETTSGGTPSRTESAYWNGDVPWVTTSLVDFGVITSAEEFITAQGLKNSSAKLFPEGTVLMAMYGQGKTRGKVALLGVKAATNQACAAILPRKDIDPYFVFLNLAGRYEEIREMSNSGGQENLSQGLIREIRFSFPPRDDEQRKVTVCLGSLDAQITAETQKLDTLKTHKKGLMQQLFPSPDEAAA